MKFTFALLGAAAAAVDADTERAFIQYIAEQGKSYGTREEFEFRLNIFAAKMQFVENHNSQNTDDHTVELNHMADWTEHEYKKLLGYKAHLKTSQSENIHTAANFSAPASVDWRTKGAVTAIKNQGQCGSCWAFSTVGALEGAYALSGNTLTSMSEQQLVDCSTNGNMGCNGGLMDYAFTYLEGAKLDTEASYPYQAKQSTCRASSGSAVTGDSSYTDVTVNDPVALQQAVAQQPVSIAVDAAALGWQLYRGGIVKRFCGTSLDHGVLLVGYGTENGTDYWIVKNSWGTSWGEKGYIRLLREMNKQGAGMCGLQQSASYPTI